MWKFVVLKVVVLVFISTLLLSCKKTYTCRCKYGYRIDKDFELYNTKRRAKITCKSILNNRGFDSCTLLSK